MTRRPMPGVRAELAAAAWAQLERALDQAFASGDRTTALDVIDRWRTRALDGAGAAR
jgi:hypothetical protein